MPQELLKTALHISFSLSLFHFQSNLVDETAVGGQNNAETFHQDNNPQGILVPKKEMRLSQFYMIFTKLRLSKSKKKRKRGLGEEKIIQYIIHVLLMIIARYCISIMVIVFKIISNN